MLVADLRIFIAVASAGSLSAAARQLDVAPMQVSRRLSVLEEELGVRLFHRTTRSVSLTAEAENFIPYASSIVETEDSAKAELSPSLICPTGILRITAPSIFGQEILLPLLPRILEQHPELRIDVDLSDHVVDIVAQGLDLAFRVAPLDDSELVARKLAANPRIIVAAPAYLERYGCPRTLADLHKHECIALHAVPRWPFVVDGSLQRQNMQGRLCTTSVGAARSAATLGLGLAMLTYWDVFTQLNDRELVQVELQDAQMEELCVWAVTPTRRYVPTRVKIFLNALEAHIATLG